MDGPWEVIMTNEQHFTLPILAAFLLMGLSALLSSTTFAQENLVYNGDFDLQVPANGTGNGWTSANVGASAWYESGGNYFFILNSSGGVASDPIIEQTITGLVIGEVYLIQGEYRNFYGLTFCNTSALSFGVEVDNQIVLELKYLSDIFSPFEVSFVASATEQTIRFSAERNGSDCDYAIDNIQVYSLNMIFEDGFEGTSVESCTDVILNQDETDVDCGGSVCAGCPFGNACVVDGDCLSGVCNNEGRCQ